MDHQRITELAQKFIDGSITAAELEEFNSWYYSDDSEEYVVTSFENREELSVDMFRKVMMRMGKPTKEAKRYQIWPRIAVAVAMAVVVFGAGLFYFTKDGEMADQNQMAVSNDIGPGKNGATITLANGKTIALSGSKTGLVVAADLRYSDGTALTDELENGTGADALIAATSTGQTYQFVLPDGTRVWLNAASRLTFPSKFTGRSRLVSIQGEGYFEVAKDKLHPFIVASEGQQLEVLGTHFNINAYADEGSTKTTLVEGSVSVSSLASSSLRGEAKQSHHAIVLKPNQQATNTGDNITVKQVDPEQAVAWKSGLFLFQGESLEEIMRRVERWYDVEVVYDAGVNKSELYGGGVSRYENVSKVLRKLELTGDIHFKIEGRKIIVMK